MKRRISAIVACLFIATLVSLYVTSEHERQTYVIPMRDSVIVPDIVDIHYEPITDERHYATIERIAPLHDGSIQVYFSQNGHTGPSRLVPTFTHSENILINQTFAVLCYPLTLEARDELCHNVDGYSRRICTEPTNTTSYVEFLQYLGTTPDRDGIMSYKFFHAPAELNTYMPCNYPDVIKNSIDVRSFHYKPHLTYVGEIGYNEQTDEQKRAVYDHINTTAGIP